jgi:hypothetical protein
VFLAAQRSLDPANGAAGLIVLSSEIAFIRRAAFQSGACRAKANAVHLAQYLAADFHTP